ncbi:DUF58 domain-containing protein [Ancylobacter dichloromethanicus]|uniref:DUF58 domain-containing protein n=1 Tax=Ancylobacter dichloromethanicus TaxID=518825 RepID=A0A9W6J8Q9_9HYPH|nr:DUF58 domain-containing protein [Ancylobacter dichloromethanicus]MBS7554334.1 DUF58 domain-containing protein [Ancylobacter dichloromethanicus]GLK71459.1 hypothetical protein GCM10017643_15740 [Ancylobacter dichloromethanicus]
MKPPAGTPTPPAGTLRPAELRPLPYRLRWRPEGIFPGAHPGRGEGAEGEFRRHVSLLRQPDPRRIDLRVSLRDPHGELHVRQFAPRRTVPVAALVDLSGSMRFGETVPQRVAELCAVLALSAVRSADSFGLFGCDAGVNAAASLPFSRRRGLEQEVHERLAAARPQGAGAAGLFEAAERLPGRRALVFLVSDFLMPAGDIDRLLDALWRHDLIPVIVRDGAVEENLPRWGLIELGDLETGAARLVFMRPALRARWVQAAHERRRALGALFARRGLRPFDLTDTLDTDALAERLMEG